MEYVLTVRNNQKNTPFVFVVSKGQKLLKKIKRMAQHQWQHWNISRGQGNTISYTGNNELVNYIIICSCKAFCSPK